jgi:hypothetical protein
MTKKSETAEIRAASARRRALDEAPVEDLLDFKQAATYLEGMLAASTIAGYMARGEIMSRRFNGRWLTTAAVLDEFRARPRRKPGRQPTSTNKYAPTFRASARRSQDRKRAERLAEGMCLGCGKNPSDPEHPRWRCEECRAARRRKQAEAAA